jgi:hypothetical protein
LLNDYWAKTQQIAEISKWLDIAQAKFEIIDKLFTNIGIRPKRILLPTFNPIVLLLEQHYDCIVVADQSLKYSWQSNSEFVDSLGDVGTVDVCLALDEYFTYADSENAQRDLLDQIKKVLSGYLITTLQDYKNNAPHKRSQVDASNSNNIIIVEENILDRNNKQNWENYIYFIENHSDLTVLGPTPRRTMYFKQLAKYCSDLQGTEYVIQKNLLYRGFYKRNYEHIITVRFV